MAVEWTGLSPELLVPLDRNLAEGLRSQLERGLRDAIRTGRLRAGERLPSTRELASALGVSRGLVVDCFDQLQAEGYLVARAGSATRVASTAQAPPLAGSRIPSDPGPRPSGGSLSTSCRQCRIWPASPRRLGVGGPRDLPGRADRFVRLRRPVRQRGLLRTVLASYLGRVRGAAADPGRIVICSGFAQGLNLALSALAARGVQRVGFEDPGYDETS